MGVRTKTYKIYTLGCKVNQSDAAVLDGRFRQAGWLNKSSRAGLAVIVSCAVTQTAARKSRQMIARARKENPRADIFMVGCWPRIDSKTGSWPAVFIPLAADDIRLAEAIGLEAGPGRAPEPVPGRRARYFLKVQDGCEQYCSYCVIPFARGKLKSKPAARALAEARQAIKAGFREIVLAGIHLGLYGRELGTDLASLAAEMARFPGLGRLRFSSIEITEVSNRLLRIMENEHLLFCPHLHLPLQSGSDRILAAMGRPYNTAFFRRKIQAIRSRLPGLALTTDIITGFPGETEKDFEATVAFIKEAGFSRLHAFPYSAHPLTAAYRLPGQVPARVRSERAAVIRKLNEKIMAGYRQGFKGRQVRLVVELCRPGIVSGTTEYYFQAAVSTEKLACLPKIGEIVEVKLD